MLKVVDSFSLQSEKRLPSKWSSHALYILFHLCLDDSVMSDASALHSVQDTIELIMSKVSSSALTSVVSLFSYPLKLP